MCKRLLFSTLIAVVMPLCLYVGITEASDAEQTISVLMHRGYYAQAIRLIHGQLANKSLTEKNRFILLRDLARAKEKQVLAGFHVDTKEVIQAYAALHKEFPGKFNAAALLWKRASLNWQGQHLNLADAAAQQLLAEHANSAEASKAALLHTRFLIKRGRLTAARNLLLRYFGLNAGISNHEQRQGLAWLAVIDESEGRKGEKQQAYKALQRIMGKDSSVIIGDATIYAAYIHLLDQFSTRKAVLRHTENFVKRHISAPEAPAIRLLLADTLLGLGQAGKAKTIYGILESSYPHRSSGMKASMRWMMIDVNIYPDKLHDTLVQLSDLARNNQLSDIEAEAWLDQARLLTGMGKQQADIKKRSSILKRALENYALVATSDYPVFASNAHAEGTILLHKTVRQLLQQQAWFQAVILWRRFPQLRATRNGKMMFAIAQAYIQLMDFSHAETLLNKLYLQSMGSIRGQRMMLEKARLWVDRGDKDAANKILQWLSRHEQSLYRPDMLLIVANAQLNMGKASEAKQTLTGINPADLMPALNHSYWLTHAKISAQLQHWHVAANAWHHLAERASGKDKWRALYGEAYAFIRGVDYQGAMNILPHIPISARNSTWHFYVGLSAYRTGQRKRANIELNLLRNEGEKSPAYSLLARYMLDAHKIDDLGEALP